MESMNDLKNKLFWLFLLLLYTQYYKKKIVAEDVGCRNANRTARTLSLSSKWLFKHKDAGQLDEGVAIQNKSASPLLECTVEKYFETSEAGGETCHLGLLSLSIKRARIPSKKSGISLHTVR